MTIATGICELKVSLFRHCKDEAVAICQYCGRRFCITHGVIHNDGQEICSRPECQAKAADLILHLEYKEQAERRNAQGYCAHENCQREPVVECSRCRCLYCEPHLHRKLAVTRREGVLTREPASLCDHCAKRQDIWAKL